MAFALLLIYALEYKYSTLAYIFPLFWGFQDSGLNCLMNVTLANEFNSKILPFSVFKFVQSLCIFVFLIAESNIKTSKGFAVYYICAAMVAVVS